jgi:hypothetical protein
VAGAFGAAGKLTGGGEDGFVEGVRFVHGAWGLMHSMRSGKEKRIGESVFRQGAHDGIGMLRVVGSSALRVSASWLESVDGFGFRKVTKVMIQDELEDFKGTMPVTAA